jgi:hypothetical protein
MLLQSVLKEVIVNNAGDERDFIASEHSFDASKGLSVGESGT